ncbi:MAG: hypothetical protein ACRYFX_09135 [Janthinobacterium lividum]
MLFAQKALYESKKQFAVWDFLISHGQLLLRADKIRDSRGINTDVIFSGTAYMQLPTYLMGGIAILQDTSSKRFGYKTIDDGLDKGYYNVFEIKADDTSYYVVAGTFGVFENELPFGKTSLGVAQNEGRNKKIAGNAI